MPDEIVERGLTAFAAPPSPTYRYIISCKAGKISISLEDQKTKQQWRTGYLAEDAYLTSTNRMGDATVANYVSIFKETLDYLVGTDGESNCATLTEANVSKTRRKLSAVEGGLQLELSVKIKARQCAWGAKFVFQLAPVSLERVDILEARLRDTEDLLASMKSRLEALEKAEVVFVAADSYKLNDEDKFLWDPIEADEFALTEDRSGIRFLVSGYYTVNLNAFVGPQREGVNIDQRKNGKLLESTTVAFNDDDDTSASIGFSAHFDENDEYSVTLVGSWTRTVDADVTIAKIGN